MSISVGIFFEPTNNLCGSSEFIRDEREKTSSSSVYQPTSCAKELISSLFPFRTRNAEFYFYPCFLRLLFTAASNKGLLSYPILYDEVRMIVIPDQFSTSTALFVLPVLNDASAQWQSCFAVGSFHEFLLVIHREQRH